MKNSIDGNGFLSLAMTLKSTRQTEATSLGWVGNPRAEMGGGGEDVGTVILQVVPQQTCLRGVKRIRFQQEPSEIPVRSSQC